MVINAVIGQPMVGASSVRSWFMERVRLWRIECTNKQLDEGSVLKGERWGVNESTLSIIEIMYTHVLGVYTYPDNNQPQIVWSIIMCPGYQTAKILNQLVNRAA